MKRVTRDIPLFCFYCEKDGKRERAHVTIHDKRGCLDVCIKHAQWRFTTSQMSGHSESCSRKV